MVRDLEVDQYPSADKIFLWKTFREAIPTNLNMFKKKVVIKKPNCLTCTEEEETAAHASKEFKRAISGGLISGNNKSNVAGF